MSMDYFQMEEAVTAAENAAAAESIQSVQNQTASDPAPPPAYKPQPLGEPDPEPTPDPIPESELKEE